MTGRGADLIIIDDPLNASNAYSAIERERANTWFDTALFSRIDNRDLGAIIVVMQRLHENDLTGHLLERGGWTKFCLQDRNIEAARTFRLLTSNRAHILPAGADLMPTRLTRGQQDDLLANMGEAAFSAQFLQTPIPQGGAIVKFIWFRSYTDPLPRNAYREIIHSWDVATKLHDSADYSVRTIWGITHVSEYHLLHCDRVKREFPDLLRLAKQLLREHLPTHFLVEDAANGTALYQELPKGYGYTACLIRPQHDKEARLHAATPVIEAERVYLPAVADWRAAYIHELTGFPGARHDDQVDSTTLRSDNQDETSHPDCRATRRSSSTGPRSGCARPSPTRCRGAWRGKTAGWSDAVQSGVSAGDVSRPTTSG